MKVTLLRGNSDHHQVMWEVHEGDKWWTVAFFTRDGSYFINGCTGREVSPAGKLGRRLISATKEYQPTCQ